MKEIVVLSGKGGTGKTSIVGSFAAIARNKVMADCDVDAADLNLILRPDTVEKYEFYSGKTAVIDPDTCTGCGACEDACRFDAIRNETIDPISCEGCGFCSHICPVGAIRLEDCNAGKWYISSTRYGRLIHARLGIARENSGKLVAIVRRQAKNYAEEKGLDYIICDGPPGTGCPVISSVSGADLALIVTEPTLSGIHDMERVIDVCRHFGVPAMVCVNKYDLNEANTEAIGVYCRENDIQLAARIPFDNTVTEAMIRGEPVVEYSDGPIAAEITAVWKKITMMLGEEE